MNTATPQPQSKKRDLSAFFGGWSREEAAEFDKNIAECEKIDEELWNILPA